MWFGKEYYAWLWKEYLALEGVLRVAREAVLCVDDDVELRVLGCRLTYLGTNCDQCLSMAQRCFTSTETVRLIRDGEPSTATTTFPKLLSFKGCAIQDQRCFTSTETIRLVRTESHVALRPQKA